MPSYQKYLVTISIYSILIGCTFLSVKGQDDLCLSCLCEASTRCNATIGCTPQGEGGRFCGPFLISEAYWTDAGSEVLRGDSPDNPSAYENCATDLICSSNSVRSYMTKFSQDCNQDGQVTCTDFAYIHVLGGYGCQAPQFTETPFYKRFSDCMNVLSSAQPSQL